MSREWINRLAKRDEPLFEELTHLEAKLRAEPERFFAADISGAALESAIALKIVQAGRPSVPIRDGRMVTSASVDPASVIMLDRLKAAATVVEPAIPAVGRLDTPNAGTDYVGTGWLIKDDIVVTNAHVARVIARSAKPFAFHLGVDTKQIRLSIDAARELSNTERRVVDVVKVLWIEPKTTGLDIAFLQVGANTILNKSVTLSTTPAKVKDGVVAVGYPGLDDSVDPLEKAKREKVFGQALNFKCASPGEVDKATDTVIEHDCSTLQGNSGSILISMQTGAAVAIHTGGKGTQNFAIPIAAVVKRLDAQPWKA